MINEKLLKALLASLAHLEDTQAVLKRIEGKLDAQSHSKLSGACDQLRIAFKKGKVDNVTLKLCPQSFSESSIYFEAVALDSVSDVVERLRWYNATTEAHAVVAGGKAILDAYNPKTLFGIRRIGVGRVKALTEFCICANHFTLAAIGRLACMKALRYSASTIDEDFRRIYTDELLDKVNDRVETEGGEVYFDDLLNGVLRRAWVRRDVPARVLRMNSKEWEDAFDVIMWNPHESREEENLGTFAVNVILGSSPVIWLSSQSLRDFATAYLRLSELRSRIITCGGPSRLLLEFSPPRLEVH